MKVQVISVDNKSSKNLDRRGFLKTSLSATSALLLLPVLATTPSRANPIIWGIVRLVGGLLSSRFIAVGLLGIYATSAWSKDDIGVVVDVENSDNKVMKGPLKVAVYEKSSGKKVYENDTHVSVPSGEHSIMLSGMTSWNKGRHKVVVQAVNHEAIVTGHVS